MEAFLVYLKICGCAVLIFISNGISETWLYLFLNQFPTWLLNWFIQSFNKGHISHLLFIYFRQVSVIWIRSEIYFREWFPNRYKFISIREVHFLLNFHAAGLQNIRWMYFFKVRETFQRNKLESLPTSSCDWPYGARLEFLSRSEPLHQNSPNSWCFRVFCL